MSRFCYHHHRSLSRHRNFRPQRRLDPFFEPGRHIRLLPVEDRGSLQTALSQAMVKDLLFTDDYIDLAPRALTADDDDFDPDADSGLKINDPVLTGGTEDRQKMHSIVESTFGNKTGTA